MYQINDRPSGASADFEAITVRAEAYGAAQWISVLIAMRPPCHTTHTRASTAKGGSCLTPAAPMQTQHLIWRNNLLGNNSQTPARCYVGGPSAFSATRN